MKKSVQLTEQQKEVLTGMLNRYKMAYGFAAECDNEIDNAFKLQNEFGDSDVPFEEYDVVAGRSSYIAKHIMNLSLELKKEIDRITNLLKN